MESNTSDRSECHNHEQYSITKPYGSTTHITHVRPLPRLLMSHKKHIRILYISLLIAFNQLYLLRTVCAQYHDAGDTTLASDLSATVPAHNKCEPITISICKNIPYNMTIMPNLFGHTRQDEAGYEVYHFAPLVKVGCSPHLQFFLCLLYVPLCTILDQPIPPCQSLCKSARKCETAMKAFGYDWPDNLECSKFPEDGTDTLCVGQHSGDADSAATNKKPLYSTKMIDSDSRRRNNAPTASDSNIGRLGSVVRNFHFVCPLQLKIPADMGYSLKVGETVSSCRSRQIHLLMTSHLCYIFFLSD